ncbi:MAG: UDP-4-amino-4,6-dideoxy-N-acetyl-beta-L-altrosamine transaminase [Verrucomicrobia bacterium]|nr:UDP-4-amino-4,6-dideoxy-N-acetyl-beta-L-altrosamine transaminase [Verrucomicrobiota bacterium]
MIPYGRQSISEEDIAAVVRSLRSDFLTCGPEVEAFEKEFAAFVGAKHAVVVCNATAALHLAMRVLGIGPGDRVVTSPITFVASANAAAYVGAIPDFCDIDPATTNLDPEALEAGWQSDTKAVVAVDYAGQPCNMPEIARIARSHGAFVIEDACHGTGGGFQANGQKWKLGGHPWADITTFSFHPVKTLTTGEGGVLLTENDKWAAKARLLRTHGITRNPTEFTGLAEQSLSSNSDLLSPVLAERGPWYYEMQELSYNYRITDLQCALGRSQLQRLPEFIARRQEIASRYNQAFATIDWLQTPALASRRLDPRPSTLDSSFSYQLPDLSLHLYTVQIDFSRLGKTRIEVMHELKEQGIGTQVLYIPVYLQPWYRRTYGYAPGKCTKAEEFYTLALSLPLYPSMSDADVEKVIQSIVKIKRLA